MADDRNTRRESAKRRTDMLGRVGQNSENRGGWGEEVQIFDKSQRKMRN